ncbi:MAG TPA: hypothetical protein VLT13_05120 [Bacteroidota bacterium]|nr:hypothetical protein [Bacteroidota bacterium]
MNCQEYGERITPAVDYNLRRDEELSFEHHTLRCPPCRQSFESERVIKQFIQQRLPMVALPESLSRALNALLRESCYAGVSRRSQYQPIPYQIVSH